MRRSIFVLLWGLLFLVVPVLSTAEERGVLVPTPLTKNVGDYYVSIGVMPISQLKSQFPRAYNLLVKYHGEPSEKDTHHLAVSVWKEKEGGFKYLSGFTVEVEVRSPIFRATRKKLSKYPHQYGDNYGGWFDMSDKGLYHIAVIIHEDGKTRKVDFDYLVQ